MFRPHIPTEIRLCFASFAFLKSSAKLHLTDEYFRHIQRIGIHDNSYAENVIVFRTLNVTTR